MAHFVSFLQVENN